MSHSDYGSAMKCEGGEAASRILPLILSDRNSDDYGL